MFVGQHGGDEIIFHFEQFRVFIYAFANDLTGGQR
jgi:hypothetical protein